MQRITIMMVLALLCGPLAMLTAQSTHQVVVTGGHLVLAGNTQLVLSDTDLEVDGTLTANENSIVHFSGMDANTATLNGAAAITLENLTVNRSNGSVQLGQDLTINNAVNLDAGSLELNGKTLTLTTGATLENESSSSYVTGTQGGTVTTTVDYDAAVNSANPGNLGAIITTPVALGSTKVTRSHVAQTVGGTSSILRAYDITPNDNEDLDATVALTYLDHELNGKDEASLEVWSSENGTWMNKAATSRDETNNTVTTEGFDELGTLTLSNGAPKLAVSAFLEGAYASGAMTTGLSENDLLPTTEPYTNLGYTHTGNGGGEIVDADNLKDVTDWVVIELRDANDATSVVASRAALLLADGSVVDVDAKSPVFFAGISAGNYYVVVRHRNHFGVMTEQPIAVTLGGVTLDMTDPNTATYGTDARKDMSGTMLLWAGDASGDGLVDASDLILHWLPDNGQFMDYDTTSQAFNANSDLNCDGLIDATDLVLYWLANNGRIQQLPQ